MQQEEFFGRLVSEYGERLYWHVRSMVGRHEDAHDLMQDIYIKVWKALPGFRGDAEPFTWLWRIATNETISFLTKRQTRSDQGAMLAAERLPSDPWFDGDRLQEALHRCIAKLPPKQKAVFNLRYFEDMPYSEIADVLETSEGSLKASYHHAYEKIKEWMQEEMDMKI